MTILITGASGLIGRALVAHLSAEGHVCRCLRRQPGASAPLTWDIENQQIQLEEDVHYDAVIHLAGESIAQGRWTVAKKARIRNSRQQGTTLLATTLAQRDRKPSVFISASAIGYYGDRPHETLNETSTVGSGFLADVCQAWEAATQPAQAAGIRVVQARLGVVLSGQGGALHAMLTPFRFGLGGRIGAGQQVMSWIALDDVVAILTWLLEVPTLRGPVNLVAPHPVTNEVFTQTLGRVLHRPTLFPLPAFVARLVFGELADALLLSSLSVEPKALLGADYSFRYETVESALTAAMKAT